MGCRVKLMRLNLSREKDHSRRQKSKRGTRRKNRIKGMGMAVKIIWVLRVWKSRPNRGRERGRGKREVKEILCQDRVDSGSTGRSPRT
jgi:hypothetical protein